MAAILETRSSAVQLLLKSSNPELRRLVVHESDDEVVLVGQVSSYYLKQLAQETVRTVAAGRRIENLVDVTR